MKYIFYFLLFPLISYSQPIQFIYDLNCRLNTQNLQEITHRRMILSINKNYSIFQEETNKTGSLKRKDEVGPSNVAPVHQFDARKNLTDNKTEKIVSLFYKNFAIPIEEYLEWNISAEKKLIGKYTAQKAEVKYGGRNWIAWFTKELPYKDGPYIFSGLPGLIVLIEDINRDYSFKLVELHRIAVPLVEKTNLIPINWVEYETILKSYFDNPFTNDKMTEKIIVSKSERRNLVETIEKIQENIVRNNNPIEINYKINY